MNSISIFTREVTVGVENGLHLTPMSQIVNLAQKFNCLFQIRKGDKLVDGKSMFDMLSLAAEHGQVLSLEAQGDDAAEAIAAIAGLFERNFTLGQVD
ncbi:MAG: HPr family phosphocarrier protein [Planctomycetaceae bacterium]|nr:HPr family phosphocarrier protein [Planctomycetaceae bacterium]